MRCKLPAAPNTTSTPSTLPPTARYATTRTPVRCLLPHHPRHTRTTAIPFSLLTSRSHDICCTPGSMFRNVLPTTRTCSRALRCDAAVVIAKPHVLVAAASTPVGLLLVSVLLPPDVVCAGASLGLLPSVSRLTPPPAVAQLVADLRV